MFRTYQILWNRLFQLIDALLVVFSFLVAWDIKFYSGWLQHGGHYPLSYYLPIVLSAVPIFLFSNWVMGLYRPMRSRSVWRVSASVVQSFVLGLLLFISLLYFLHLSGLSRTVLVLFAVVLTCISFVKQVVAQFALRWIRSRGYNKKFVVIVGWAPGADRFVKNLLNHPWYGYSVLGYTGTEVGNASVPYLGAYSDTAQIINGQVIDHVLICLSRNEGHRIPDVIRLCEEVGTQALIVPDYLDLLPANPRFETFAGTPLIDTRYVPLDDAVNAALKRSFDVAFSAGVLIALSPIILLLALVIKCSSPGPVIYAQQRIGLNRRPFTMYKFRTMVHQDSRGPLQTGWTVPNDPRRTKFGVFLRKTSLDELPQFWNVLRGEMSVIGPRPEQPGFVERLKSEVPHYMVKHRVRPGITGWAQVHGWRGDTSIAERIQYDIEYIENWSFGMDMRIVLKTLKDGLIHQNAY